MNPQRSSNKMQEIKVHSPSKQQATAQPTGNDDFKVIYTYTNVTTKN